MEGCVVVDHPLVRHKLTLMRDKNCSTKSFRQLLDEIGKLLCYEVTRDLPEEMIEIETPLTRSTPDSIASSRLCSNAILRSFAQPARMLSKNASSMNRCGC